MGTGVKASFAIKSPMRKDGRLGDDSSSSGYFVAEGFCPLAFGLDLGPGLKFPIVKDGGMVYCLSIGLSGEGMYSGIYSTTSVMDACIFSILSTGFADMGACLSTGKIGGRGAIRTGLPIAFRIMRLPLRMVDDVETLGGSSQLFRPEGANESTDVLVELTGD